MYEALRLQRSSAEHTEQVAFNSTKWSSNSSVVIQAIPDKDRASKSLLSLAGVYSVTKALGLKRETTSDRFVFRNELNSLTSSSETLLTKRGVASLAAEVFDPIGLITPLTIRTKSWLQSLWSQGLGWDEVMPEEPLRKWIQWVHERSELEQLHIPRRYTDWPSSQKAMVELHAFGDASEAAYDSAVFPKELFLKRVKHLRAL